MIALFRRVALWSVWGIILGLSSATAIAADAPSVKTALSFKPVQKNVEYDIPEPDKYGDCQVKVERRGKTSGWVVLGEAGQPLRRFIDTNNDNVVDQWRYYQNGIEVYRDQDTNFNSKVDQSRWINTAGTRWGIDKNEDGKIDTWRVLSAEEATQEAVRAMINLDAESLLALMMTPDDIRTLGLPQDVSGRLIEQTTDAEKTMREVLSGSKSLTPQSKWLRFDGSIPHTIPAEDETGGNDIMLYQNVLAIVDTAGKQGFVRFGDLIRIGDVWKLSQVPQPVEGDSIEIAESSLLMQRAVASNTTAPTSAGLSPEMQKLLEDLQKLDQNSPSPVAGRAELSKYNSQRVALLRQIIAQSSTDEEREQWMRQLIDGLTAAAQTGAFADALPQLKKLESDLSKDRKSTNMLASVVYRINLVEYNLQLQKSASDEKLLLQVQNQWLASLEDFVKKYPGAEDVPDAEMQLAMAHEFSGKMTDALKWYSKLKTDHPDSPSGRRAAGAIRRLNLKGFPFELVSSTLNGEKFSMSQLEGRVVLVIYWATWCQPCTEDLPQIRALYEQYRSQGFEIVGVNLDTEPDLIAPYLKEYRVPWVQLFEEGGLDSPLASQFGIISVPTMFLVGRDGKVLDRGISVGDLKTGLPDILKAK
ncbi:MAG: thioredoxin-like domain-containing protein [Planctomycetota bacterium]|nr:thioredoxin-like domain-containing protein [Planctomycetota bacterium]MDA1214336.1 thioredoxin-like domain-containing protein [Planctomycetota bacterium]